MNNMRVTKTHGHQDAMSAVASQRPKTCDLRPATRKRIITALFIFAVVWLILPQTTRAATYYVDQNHPQASNSNPGTEDLPWLSIQRATATLIAGDTVYIKEGIYKETVLPQNSGTEGNYITYRAYPGHEAIIESPNQEGDDPKCIYLSRDENLHHLIFKDLTLRNANFANFYAYAEGANAKHNIILDGLRSESGYIGVLFANGVTDSEIKNCEIHYNQYGIDLEERNKNILVNNNHISHSQVLQPEKSPFSHNIQLYTDTREGFYTVGDENTNIIITNNNLHDAQYTGVVVWAGKNVLVKNNHCHHNGSTGIQIESNGRVIAENIVVEGNICEDNSQNSQNFRHEAGIWIDDTDNAIVQNNIMRGNGFGLRISGSFQVIARNNLIYENCKVDGTSGGVSVKTTDERQNGGDDIVVHNTFYGNSRTGQDSQILIWKYQNEPEISNVAFKNNIASESLASFDLWVDGLTHTLDCNNYYNSRDLEVRWNGNNLSWPRYLETSGQDFHSLTSNPLFVDPNAANPEQGFLLQSGSPCIDKGGFLTKTANAGSGTVIRVADARYFTDGFFTDGFRLIEGDLIQLEGSNKPVRITVVDYKNNVLTVDQSISWNAGVGVSYAYSGSAPDIGAYEYIERIPIFLYGDINGDSLICSYDAALAAHIAVALEHPDIKNPAAAEVSGDGEVGAYDAALIAQRAVGLIEKFPVE